MTSPHTDPWPATAIYPRKANIKPGDWLVLIDGHIVGPVAVPVEDMIHTYVESNSGKWMVDVLDDPEFRTGRLVVFAGSLQHACTYRLQMDLADQIIDEIIAEALSH